jgi:hypothetical protein
MVRATWPVLFTLSLGIAVLMIQGSGYAATVSGNPTSGLGPLGDSVQEQANSSVASNQGDGLAGQASGSDEPLISFILSGGGAILSTAKLVATLPVALISLGAPVWFAVPVGGLAQIVVGIGILQFITNREFR